MKKKKEELTEFEKSVIAKLYQGASLAGRMVHSSLLTKHYALFALFTDY